MRPRRKFEGHKRRVNGVIHLPDGHRIITCSNDGSLRLWNLESGEQIGSDWRDKGSALYTIALSPDGKKIVSGSEDGGVRLWNIDTGKVITKWTGHGRGVSSLCWTQDGGRVVSGGSFDGTARVWNVESGETVLAIETGFTLVEAVIYSPDSTSIGTCGDDEEKDFVKIWDSKTGELVADLKGHQKSVHCLAWTADGKTLVSGSVGIGSESIRTWNTTTWQQISILTEHLGDSIMISTAAITISLNDRILASASYDGAVRLWNLKNGQPIGSPLQHAHRNDGSVVACQCVAFSKDGELLVTGCLDHNVYTWDVSVIVREPCLEDLLSNTNRLEDAYPISSPDFSDNSSGRPSSSRLPSTVRTRQAVGSPSSHGRTLAGFFSSLFRRRR